MGQAYRESLAQKHATLEQEISSEERRPHPDDIRIASMKKRKLRLKDELRTGA